MKAFRFAFFCLFLIPLCELCNAGNSNVNLISTHSQDSKEGSFIYVKFLNKTNSFPSFSIFDELENQNMILANDTLWQSFQWKSNYTFCLSTSVFNAAYPVKAGDSIMILNKEQNGFDIKILNSSFNPYEINFFNFLSLKNQNMLDYYFRKVIPNANYPTQSSARKAFDACIMNLNEALKEHKIDKAYYDWAKKIILLSYYASMEKYDRPDDSVFLDSNNLENHFFRKFLQNYLINHQLNSTYAKVDFEKAYSFSKINFDGPIKDYLLFFITKQLIEKTNPTRKVNINRFLGDVSNPTYASYFNNNYLLKDDSNIAVGQNMVFTIDGITSISLEEILEKNKGKLIYMDFWASWCVPCIAALPDSKKLRETYSSQKIAFLYISIDDKKLDWKNALKRYGLEMNGQSFLLADPIDAEIVKKFSIREIPRYILINTDGTIISENAPSPGTKELTELIEKYIKK